MMAEVPEGESLLSKNALQGVRIGISVSQSPDLKRLGLLETHFRLVLGELARTILVSGGELNYGGHLESGGYTDFLIHELHRFGRKNRPFHSILPWQEHRSLTIKYLRSQEKRLGLHGDITGLNLQGAEMNIFADRSSEALPESDPEIIKRSLTSMRRYLAKRSDGHVFIGGQRNGFQGDMPGILEEVLLALGGGQPIYLAGGFGGVTADIIRILGVEGDAWIPKDVNGLAPDPRWERGLEQLAAFQRKNKPSSSENGLTETENRILAVSYRPSEIAALVSLGMGRKFQQKNG